MAALCPGVQYGLSSQQNFSENKDLIFVKLTDSALRAIEDYLKNQNTGNGQNPRIRFLGNANGELLFPSQHHESGHTSFSFAMSTTADMEGPAGSFECIQGNSPRGPLECLGSIRNKMRIHANDDVYEATRNRMAEVEDKYKNKCTREIKMNQTDIGRKVKVKQPNSSSRPPLLPSVQQSRPALPSMRDSLLKQSSYPIPSTVKPPQNNLHSSLNHNLSNGLGSNHVSSSQRSTVQHNRKPSVPEVARRPLRERLIHLLALRPFKKIELHDRLTKEGLRGTNSMTTVLKQIAQLRDNCYHLNRNMWNEVNDDWPFYTETEKQILKRKKPQNLTPPGGSDGGSSGSGQSPTSTHPGSPPMITSTNGVSGGGGGGGAKRQVYREGGDGLPYKRQRIAHGAKGSQLPQTGAPDGPFVYNSRQQVTPDSGYRQSDSAYNNRSPVDQNNSQRRPATDLRDASNMNPRSRESPPNGYFNSYDNLPPTEDDRNKRQCDSANGLTFGVTRENVFRSGSPVNNALMTEEARRGTNSPIFQNQSNGFQREKDRRSANNHKVSSSSHRIARVSPDSQTEGLPSSVPERSLVLPNRVVDEEEFPDYKKQYVKITSAEQKKLYKADFNAHYSEYKSLYPIVEKVSKRFVQLEEELKQEGVNSPRYKDIKKRIVREYNEMKKDLEHQRAKNRFQYLHEKLSYIKKLVGEYDQAQAGLVKC
ncbi:RNA polymerase II elongation factor ELL [Euwallacea similis]|uniref:RNA polymerase II elongation factor ELL n=1 Tax=Euwallacea similis TaxID=1736056 RepID=UPI00344DC695